MTHGVQSDRWKSFWNRGGLWRALLLLVVYYGIYQLIAVGTFYAFSGVAGSGTSPLGVVLLTGLPIALGAVVLLILAWSIGWLPNLFGPQRVRSSGWMWIAVVVVLGTNLLRFATLDYGAAGAQVPAWLLTGLAVGLAEELLTRGFVVELMRRAGHPEIVVCLTSAALFAMLHLGNAIGGQSLFVTAFQVAYTFAFGVCLYLALRVGGRLLCPVLLHACTDPSIFLLAAYPRPGALTSIAGLGNILVIITGLVLLIFVRGRSPGGARRALVN